MTGRRDESQPVRRHPRRGKAGNRSRKERIYLRKLSTAESWPLPMKYEIEIQDEAKATLKKDA